MSKLITQATSAHTTSTTIATKAPTNSHTNEPTIDPTNAPNNLPTSSPTPYVCGGGHVSFRDDLINLDGLGALTIVFEHRMEVFDTVDVVFVELVEFQLVDYFCCCSHFFFLGWKFVKKSQPVESG
jgi:hypothetical protein